MKIIGVDNLNHDDVSDVLVADGLSANKYSELLCDLLNYGRAARRCFSGKLVDKPASTGAYFYSLVDDSYHMNDGVHGPEPYSMDTRNLVAMENGKETIIATAINIKYIERIMQYLSHCKQHGEIEYVLREV